MCFHAKRTSAQRTRYSPLGPPIPAQGPVRVRLYRVLLGQWPSLRDLLRPSLACVRPLRWYYAAVRLPIAVHVGLIAHRLLPPIRRLAATDGNRVSRFSRAQRAPSFHACLGSTTPQCLRPTSDITRATVLPSGLPDTVGAPDFGYFGAHQLQGYPADMCPCPTLQVRRYRRPRMVGARMVRYSFSCMTLSFTTSRRFIPTLSRPGGPPHKSTNRFR